MIQAKVDQLVRALLVATSRGRIEWHPAFNGYEARIAEGTVVVHQPTHDQRDGNFARVLVLDEERQQIGESTAGLPLWDLIKESPKHNLLDSMIAELGE